MSDDVKTQEEKDNDKAKQIERQAGKAIQALGFDRYDDGVRPGEIAQGFERLKLCHKCYSLRSMRTEFNTFRARCSMWEVNLSGRDPVVDCSSFSDKTMMSLDLMVSMAILIDPPSKKAGFTSNDE